jgi:opacity protein-like surface antigen
MKKFSILAGLAVVALLVAVSVQAEMVSVSDSDLDAVAGKGNATITFGGYSWDDDHSLDNSDHKGALANDSSVTMTGINVANVWGAYAGADVLASENNCVCTDLSIAAGITATSDATANLAIGGF